MRVMSRSLDPWRGCTPGPRSKLSGTIDVKALLSGRGVSAAAGNHDSLMAGVAARVTDKRVLNPEERKFLGFSISNDGSERRIASKALDKFKAQIRDVTRGHGGSAYSQLIDDLRPYLIGWRGYFGFCQTCAYRLCHPNVVPMETAEPND